VSVFFILSFASRDIMMICIHINGKCLRQLASVSVSVHVAVVVSVMAETKKSAFRSTFKYTTTNAPRTNEDVGLMPT